VALWTPIDALADVGATALAAKRSRVIASCTKHWEENKGDCSAFVRAVAKDVGFTLTGNANAIHGQISTGPWIRIGVGTAAATAAGVASNEGKFVVASRNAQPNGHVAVVVDYRNAFDSYSAVEKNKAVGFWGSLNAVGDQYQRITLSWNATDMQQVLFAYRPIP
jgi:hypothetical protein